MRSGRARCPPLPATELQHPAACTRTTARPSRSAQPAPESCAAKALLTRPLRGPRHPQDDRRPRMRASSSLSPTRPPLVTSPAWAGAPKRCAHGTWRCSSRRSTMRSATASAPRNCDRRWSTTPPPSRRRRASNGRLLQRPLQSLRRIFGRAPVEAGRPALALPAAPPAPAQHAPGGRR